MHKQSLVGRSVVSHAPGDSRVMLVRAPKSKSFCFEHPNPVPMESRAQAITNTHTHTCPVRPVSNAFCTVAESPSRVVFARSVFTTRDKRLVVLACITLHFISLHKITLHAVHCEHDLAVFLSELVGGKVSAVFRAEDRLGNSTEQSGGLGRLQFFSGLHVVGAFAEIAGHSGCLVGGLVVGGQDLGLDHGNLALGTIGLEAVRLSSVLDRAGGTPGIRLLVDQQKGAGFDEGHLALLRGKFLYRFVRVEPVRSRSGSRRSSHSSAGRRRVVQFALEAASASSRVKGPAGFGKGLRGRCKGGGDANGNGQEQD
mmetsp:Transcript_13158/g.30693  ORF Transcript_13158/g.30693 Transcript_13158/m.30693 type:complete len:313 (-) Transcript_13158:39-977(-)